MDWFVKAFLKASVSWLAAGVTLGVAMGAYPPWTVYRTAHLHMLLLGFVAQMIFGVAYHVIPRFAGNPLRSGRAAGTHWWLANLGLATMVAGFVLRAQGRPVSSAFLAIGGTAAASGAYVFAFLVFRTLDRPRRHQSGLSVQ
jgi:heme/copper-type cytochrome/quinol oxidase subunit 1